MDAYLWLDGVEGESKDQGYEKWVVVKSATFPIVRTISASARGHERERGSTIPGEVTVSRSLDKSSVKLAEKCAKGNMIPEVKVHLVSKIQGRNEPIMQVTLRNAIITNYEFTGATGDQVPAEEVSINYEAIDWNYTVVAENRMQGNVAASYSPKA